MNTKFIKFFLIFVVVAGFIAFLVYFQSAFKNTSKKDEKKDDSVEMKLIAENKADLYNNFLVDEWNGYRFKYKDSWTVEKKYDGRNLKNIIIKPKDGGSENSYIFMGGDNGECVDIKKERCVIAGYGLITEPIYIFSKEELVVTAFDSVISSIGSYQGIIFFDSMILKNTLNSFGEAEKNNDKNSLRKLISPNIFSNYEIKKSNLLGSNKWGKYEIVNNFKILSQDSYQATLREYEYSGEQESEIGYIDIAFVLKNVNNLYIIESIDFGVLNQAKK